MNKHVARLVSLVALLGAFAVLVSGATAKYNVPKCHVPKVSGQSLGAAEAAIVAGNCSVGKISTGKSSSVPIGNVISTAPPGGQNLPAGKAVNIKVSIGNPKPPVPGKKCVVPHVKGDTLAGAAKAIEKANCTVGKVKAVKSKKVKSGKVISSSPSAGAKKPAGAKVNLKISKGAGKKKKK